MRSRGFCDVGSCQIHDNAMPAASTLERTREIRGGVGVEKSPPFLFRQEGASKDG
jgi:hypothetical protein